MRAYPEKWYTISPLNAYMLVVKRNFHYFFLLGAKHKKSEHLVTIAWEIFIMVSGYVFYFYSTGKV